MAMGSMKKLMSNMYGKYLIVTNTVTCAGLLGVGDCMVQNMNIAVEAKKGKTIQYDYNRTGRMMVMGFVLGPFNHTWYKLLDVKLKGNRGKVVFQKIMCDQMVAGPFFATSFLIGMGLLEGKTLNEANSEWKDKFLSIYIVDWMFWPLAQFVNFRYVTSQFRVLYVSSATCIWNSILSYIKHREEEDDLAVVKALVKCYKAAVDKATTGRRSD